MNLIHEYSIEKANKSNARDIAIIHTAAWKAAYKGIIPQKFLDDISINGWQKSWHFQLKKEAKVLLIKVNFKPMGFAQICKNSGHDSEIGEINSIYIHPNVWRHGLGSKLCTATLNELKILGYQKAMLWVLSQNVNARQFYEAFGFNKVGANRIFPLIPYLELDETCYMIKLI